MNTFEPNKLDAFDHRILRTLASEGRISWRELAERIGLSLTPTLRRVRRLEHQNYITGYHARLDESLLLGTMVVFVSVTLERQKSEVIERFEQAAALMPEVLSGHQMSGGTDFLLRVAVRDLEHYRSLLEQMTSIDGVAQLQSSFALKTFVDRAGGSVAS